MSHSQYACIASVPTSNTGGAVGGCYNAQVGYGQHEFRICNTQAAADCNIIYVAAFAN